MMQPGSMVMDDNRQHAVDVLGTLAVPTTYRPASRGALERTARVWDVFALTRPRLVLLAQRRLIDASLSEDAVHDGVEGAIRYCVTAMIDDENAVFAALCNSVGWRCGELNRATSRARARCVPEGQGEAPPMPHDSVATGAEAAELSAAIQDILARLSVSDRRLLEARMLRRMTYAGVASATGTSERQAERAVERALRRLRRLYAARTEGHMCEEASEFLPLLAAGTLDAAMDAEHAALVRQHADGCLRCRMEQRFYRRSVSPGARAVVLKAGTGRIT